MPECFEKKVKRIRCLLKYYLLFTSTDPDLLKEINKDLCEGPEALIQNQLQVIPKIMSLIEEAMITDEVKNSEKLS